MVAFGPRIQCEDCPGLKLLYSPGPPKMKRPMETNRLETGPPVAKRLCPDRTKRMNALAVRSVTSSTGTTAPPPAPQGK